MLTNRLFLVIDLKTSSECTAIATKHFRREEKCSLLAESTDVDVLAAEEILDPKTKFITNCRIDCSDSFLYCLGESARQILHSVLDTTFLGWTFTNEK